MNTNSLMSVMDVIVLGAGVYVLYGWFMLMFRGEIRQGLMIPKDVRPKDCKDFEGFKSYMGIRSLILGILAVANGAMGLYQDYVQPVPPTIYWIMFGAFLIFLIWYAYCSKQALKLFFGIK